MLTFLLGPIVSIFSAIPVYFYLSGEKYHENYIVNKLFRQAVWAYSQFEMGFSSVKRYIGENEQDLVLESVIKMNGYNFYEYKIYHNEKNYFITLINLDNEEIHNMKLESLRENLEKKIDNKNLIVHCSLINKHDDIVLDVTNDFRKFKFYYDEHKNEICTPRVQYFFEYLQKKYDTLDLSDLSLMIYKNDEQFTELKHNIENLYTKTFFELLN